MRCRFWIVCLMLVLVPLRGWAAASMGVPVQADVVMAQADHGQHHDAAPPCHEPPADDATASGHACHLCDLCHSAVADQAEATLPPLPIPASPPRPAATRDTGRHAVGGLDRPPRPHLA